MPWRLMVPQPLTTPFQLCRSSHHDAAPTSLFCVRVLSTLCFYGVVPFRQDIELRRHYGMGWDGIGWQGGVDRRFGIIGDILKNLVIISDKKTK